MILMCVITSIHCIIVRYNAQAVVRAATLGEILAASGVRCR